MNIESRKPSPSSSSKKRLLSHKPKHSPNNRPDSSTIPDDDQLIFPPKKTRDLPNLSDCHGCGTHINHTNPQDRLLLLDSVWRIVLLCRKCIRRVQLLQICPYCFKECGSLECVNCSDCQRKIHKECVEKFGDSSPWLLCKRGVGVDGPLICVDCWVPELMKKSIRILKRKRVGKDLGNGVVNRKGGKSGMRVGVINDGGCLTGREVVLALMAPNYGNGKILVRKNALEVDNGGKRMGGSGKSNSESGLICYKRLRGGKGVDSEDRVDKAVDGENAGGNDLYDARVSDSEYASITYGRRDKKLGWRTYEKGSLKRNVFMENIKYGASLEVVGKSAPCLYERGSLKRKVFLETIKYGSAEVVGMSAPCLYERGSLRRKVFLETIKNASVEVVGISGTFPNSTRNTEITPSEVCNLNKLEDLYERKCTSHIMCASDASKKEVADNEKSDYYLLKYSKRQAIHKSQSSGQCNMGSALESSVNCST